MCFFHYQGVEKCLLGIIESFAVSCACVQVPLIMSLIKARGIGILWACFEQGLELKIICSEYVSYGRCGDKFIAVNLI